MAITLVDRYRRWFTYEQEAHAKTLDSLYGVPLEQRSSEEWGRATKLFAHMMVTRQVWLFRMGGPVEEPTDYFPEGKTLAELEELQRSVNKVWSTHLDQLSDEDLSRNYEYRRSDGVGFRNSVEDTLTHLFAHSFYHRGQIAALVRAMGGAPAATDFIFSFREQISNS